MYAQVSVVETLEQEKRGNRFCADAAYFYVFLSMWGQSKNHGIKCVGRKEVYVTTVILIIIFKYYELFILNYEAKG